MLWQRIVTAALLIPGVVLGILYLETPYLAAVTAIPLLIGAAEMAGLAHFQSRGARSVFVLAVAATMGLAWSYRGVLLIEPLQWLAAIWWIVVTLLMLTRGSQLAAVDRRRPGLLLLGAALLVTAWISVVALHEAGPGGPLLLLFLFVLIWVADSGAYFAGRAFGRRRLAPFISPGKTWAGAAGAAIGAVLISLALAASGLAGDVSASALVMLSLGVTLISIGGDLWESRLKREAGVKDSGRLLPGHGGVLDRVDSLVAAAPVFGLGARLTGLTP